MTILEIITQAMIPVFFGLIGSHIGEALLDKIVGMWRGASK